MKMKTSIFYGNIFSSEQLAVIKEEVQQEQEALKMSKKLQESQ